jgi:uncharacterized glyoxalase superfamily protein PhnB
LAICLATSNLPLFFRYAVMPVARAERSLAIDHDFWGAYFGSFTDKFGIDWMINCEIKN